MFYLIQITVCPIRVQCYAEGIYSENNNSEYSYALLR